MSMQQDQSYSGTLINFTKITFTRRGFLDQRAVADKGVILRLKNGRLYLQLDGIIQGSMPSSLKDNRGKIVNDSEYYKFIAIDTLGRTWTSEKVLFLGNSSIPAGLSNSRYKFQVCSNCVHVDDSDKSKSGTVTKVKSILNLLINEELELPSPWKWKIRNGFPVTHVFSSGNEISLSRGVTAENAVGLSVQYRCKSLDKPTIVAQSLCESMQFILAQQVSWFHLEHCIGSKTDIYFQPSSRKVSHNAGRAKPPIQIDRIYFDHEQQFYSASTGVEICSESQVWLLYEKYFDFVSKNKITTELHHLSGWIGRLVEIDQQSLEAELLTVSVAVESIIKENSHTFGQEKKGVEEKKKLKDKINQLRSWLKDKKFDTAEDSFYKRINGFLPNLLRESNTPKDILRGLVQNGLLDEPLLKSWGNVRNKATHGHIVKFKKFDFYIQECDKVNLLFFQLIFLIIKYEGPFSDYSQDGWPTKRFQKRASSD